MSAGGYVPYDIITYDKGGYVPGPSAFYLSADECLIRGADVRAGRIRCSRPGHPTPTSDCGKPGATIEPPEVSS